MLLSKEQLDIARWALQRSLTLGCQQSRITLIKGMSNSFEYRDGQLDRLEANTENRIYLELFIDNKFGSFSSNIIERNELETFLKEAITSTKYLEADIHRKLPDPSLCENEHMDLNIHDRTFASIETNKKLEVLINNYNEITGLRDDIVSIICSYDDGCTEFFMIDSNETEKHKIQTSFSISTSVSLKTEDNARVESYWFDVAAHWDDLQKVGLGTTALEKAVNKLNTKKIESGTYQLLLDNFTISRLLSPILNALSGASIQQKSSFLIDKQDQKAFSEKLTLVDDPFQIRKLGSRLFDSNGVATKKRIIIHQGVIKNYFIDTYYASKLNKCETIGSATGLCLSLGNFSHDELIEKITQGIWVTGFNGGNSNPTTGDFSFGIEGFYIEKGKILHPVSEMNVTGNIIELWNNVVAVGNNPRKNIANQLPSVLFENIKFSGK